MHILDDAALADVFRKDVVNAVITIFKKLGGKSEQFVPQVVPRFMPLIEKAGDVVSRGVW
jgi:hypothetical protein